MGKAAVKAGGFEAISQMAFLVKKAREGEEAQPSL
jgi:hypothetical protein